MAKKRPFLAIFGHRQSQLLYLGWTSVEQGWTLYLTYGGTSWTPLDPSKMVPAVSRGPQKVIFWPYLAIGGPSCSIWVEHRFKRVEHCISHMEGPLGPLWTHRKWSQGSQGALKRSFLAIFVNIWPRAKLPSLGWPPVEQGWTMSHIWGGAFASLWTRRKWSPESQGAPKKTIFGHICCIWLSLGILLAVPYLVEWGIPEKIIQSSDTLTSGLQDPPVKKIDKTNFGSILTQNCSFWGSKSDLQGPIRLKGGDLNTEYFMIKSITSVNKWSFVRE